MDALQVGELAQDLFLGYMAYAGITALIRHPGAANLLRQLEHENAGPASVPIEPVYRRDGTAHYFDLSHAVTNESRKESYRATHDRLWLSSAIMTLGDELTRSSLDRTPDLEFVRHLRNGIGHGNRFHFRKNEPRLPAHFTGAEGSTEGDPTPHAASTFEIVKSLEGEMVLFDFLGPGDVLDLLMHVSHRLIQIGHGDPPSPLFEQRP
jgi:hypothetical protein